MLMRDFGTRDYLWWLLIISTGLGSLVVQLPWLLMLVAVFHLVKKRAAMVDPHVRHMWLLMALLLVPCALSVIDSALISRSARSLIRFTSCGLAAALLIHQPPNHRSLDKLIIAAAIAVIFYSCDGLLQKLTGYNVAGNPEWSDGMGPSRISGFVGINYGWVMMVMSPWLFEGCRRADKTGRLYWLALPLIFLVVILSGSRASAVLLAVSTVLYAAIIGFKLGMIPVLRFLAPVAFGVLCAAGFLMVDSTLGDRWAGLSSALTTDTEQMSLSLSYRPYLWSAASALFIENPINGVGLRAFGVSAEAYLVSVGIAEFLPGIPYNWSPHLNVLEVAAELGVLGLIGYVLLLIGISRWLLSAPTVVIAPGLTALLALFPLGSTLPLFSARVSAVAWLSLATAIAFAKAVEQMNQQTHAIETSGA